MDVIEIFRDEIEKMAGRVPVDIKAVARGRSYSKKPSGGPGFLASRLEPGPEPAASHIPKFTATRAQRGLSPQINPLSRAKANEATSRPVMPPMTSPKVIEPGGPLEEYGQKMKQQVASDLAARYAPSAPSVSSGTMPNFKQKMTEEVMRDQAKARASAAAAAGASPPKQPVPPVQANQPPAQGTQPSVQGNQPPSQGTQPEAPVQPAQQASAKEYFPTFRAAGRIFKGGLKGLAIGTGIGGLYAASQGIEGLREGERLNR